MDPSTLTVDTELWLYGSRARGDADELSDTDVLVVSDGSPPSDDVAMLVPLPRVRMSVYGWREVEAMAAYGSLFLHHIATEGHPLRLSPRYPGRLSTALENLGPFMRAGADLESFHRAFEDCLNSLDNGGWPDFELQVLATMARHAAILGSYCVGRPTFGREAPFWVVGSYLGYRSAHCRALADGATKYRYGIERPQGRGGLTPRALAWIESLRSMLDELQGIVNGFEATLPRAA
jgi:hypothetical protein